MVESHIVEYLSLKGEEAGLGFYSEQAMESVHHDFKVVCHLCLVSSEISLPGILGENQSGHRSPRVWCQTKGSYLSL